MAPVIRNVAGMANILSLRDGTSDQSNTKHGSVIAVCVGVALLGMIAILGIVAIYFLWERHRPRRFPRNSGPHHDNGDGIPLRDLSPPRPEPDEEDNGQTTPRTPLRLPPRAHTRDGMQNLSLTSHPVTAEDLEVIQNILNPTRRHMEEDNSTVNTKRHARLFEHTLEAAPNI